MSESREVGVEDMRWACGEGLHSSDREEQHYALAVIFTGLSPQTRKKANVIMLTETGTGLSPEIAAMLQGPYGAQLMKELVAVATRPLPPQIIKAASEAAKSAPASQQARAFRQELDKESKSFLANSNRASTIAC